MKKEDENMRAGTTEGTDVSRGASGLSMDTTALQSLLLRVHLQATQHCVTVQMHGQT